MEAFHKIKIKCPYEILEIEEIKIKNKPNEHGYLYLKGIVDDSINFKYAIEASTEDKICIYEQNEDNENNKETIIFNGKIQNISTNNNTDGIYHIEIEAYTSSFDLDIEEKSRSFQDIEMSYDDFLNIIMADFQMYDYTQCMKKPESIGFPRFQYKESSYRMIVRTASYLGINVYCDIIDSSNAFYFGKPSGREYEIGDNIDYTATLDIQRYRKALIENPDFHPTDFFFYEIKTLKVMNIGDKVTFKQKKFYVYSYEAEYVRGELIYTYRLCREKGIWQEKLYNDKLIGISLEGKVLEVSGEQVKLHLDIDETQDQSKAAWFRYAPPTGNIMYSMPIVGTSANLYFPNERNEEPIVIGCVRKNGSSCEKFSNVNNRYFSTESGNNLDMLPDAINFSRPGLSATFNDGGGINFNSSSNLSLNAGYIGLFAGNISIQGQRRVVAKRGTSIISLESDFYNDAAMILENGTDRTHNELWNDDPQNGVEEAMAEIEAQVAESILAASSKGSIPSVGNAIDNLNDPLNLYSNKPWMNIEKINNKKENTYIEPSKGERRILDPNDAGYLYGTIYKDYTMKKTDATFYGKGEGPSLTVGGKTFGAKGDFKNGELNTKMESEHSTFEIKAGEFETGLAEVEFDNGWKLNAAKLAIGAKAGVEGIEAEAKAALAEGETAKLKIPVPLTNKNLEIGLTGDIGSIGATVKVGYGKGVTIGAHYGIGAEISFDVVDKDE